MEDEKGGVVVKLIDAVNEISAITEYRCTVKKQYCNLARRLKLLTPMFEEIRDSKEPIPEDSFRALDSLMEALESAKELLRFGAEGSKIYLNLLDPDPDPDPNPTSSGYTVNVHNESIAWWTQGPTNRSPGTSKRICVEVEYQDPLVLEREKIMNRFLEVTAHLEQTLSGISYEKLDISDEVKEQLYEDMLSIYNKVNDMAADQAVIRRLVDKLQLTGIADLTQESIALHEMVTISGGDPGDKIEKMSMLLKKIKDFVLTENPNIDSRASETPPSTGSGPVSKDASHKTTVVPDDFRCPISLELMKDPVITYERSCIEKWLEAGHGTCPKTQQALTCTVLTPNYVLRSLIAQWCEANGLEPPKRPGGSRSSKTTSACSPAERIKIESLLHKLTSGSPEDQRSAAGEIRLLAKRNADNRVAIAEAGAIPLLVGHLSTPDSRTQEHAVTALLNLSICEDNKGSIISSGAVPGIVHVLKKGSMEARENAAATLFSLSVVDENKIIIGSSGAIPPLVTLLSEGTQRGKKDAATALFNLCIYQGNKGKAVRAGVVPTLMRLLTEPQGGMVDEALAILAILASHPEGKAAIGGAEAVPVLVEVIGSGSHRNKENAAAVLVHLCGGDQQYLVEAQELGIMGPLVDLAQNGTDRGKRKAAQLLDRMTRFAEQQKQAQAQAEAQAQAGQVQNQQSQPTSAAPNSLL
ncbi:hypothetical protein LguiB_031204 [Lonicera macranthoides]